jgi:hypothetical protein
MTERMHPLRNREVERFLPMRARQVERLFTPRELLQAAEWRILGELKRSPNEPHVIRIRELLELLRKSESLRLELYKHFSKYRADDTFADARLQALNLEFRAILADIEGRLKRYQWTPRILSPRFESLSRGFTWPKQQKEYWENWAVSWLLDHADGTGPIKGRILRFRECELCNALFYGIKDWQIFCSARCQKQFNTDSPKEKVRRREYMRKYRREEKERVARQDAANKRTLSREIKRKG